MEPELLRADRRQRRIAFAILAVASLLAVAAVIGFSRLLSNWAATLATDLLVARLRLLLSILLTSSGVGLLILAAHALRVAERIRAAGCWPLPESRVLFDHVLRHGEAADRMARQLRVAGLSLTLLALGLALIAARLLWLALW